MDKIQEMMNSINSKLGMATCPAMLGLRLILGFAFYQAAMSHWSNMEGTAYFFGETLHIPFPTFNAYLATLTEFAGAILLPLGILTRYISIPLIITMLVAIFTAHWGNGFIAFKEIPQGSFLFHDVEALGSSANVEIYNAGQKLGDVAVYGTGGMEMPVIYIFMLLVLVAKGPGNISLDRFLFPKTFN